MFCACWIIILDDLNNLLEYIERRKRMDVEHNEDLYVFDESDFLYRYRFQKGMGATHHSSAREEVNVLNKSELCSFGFRACINFSDVFCI